MKKKLLKIVLILTISGIVIGGGAALYLFNMPHRNVVSAEADYSVLASQLVDEYLSTPDKANDKYLSSDGDSKILEVTGNVSKVSEDYNGQKIILLKSDSDKAGVSATFTIETSSQTESVAPGQTITLKGVIRSGAGYDDDLGLYENVIIEKTVLIK